MEKKGRWQAASEFGIILAGTLCGLFSLPGIVSVLGLSVLLLFVNDRGQHRELGDRFRQLPRWEIVGLSVGSYLALNLVALSAAYALGRVVVWLLKS